MARELRPGVIEAVFERLAAKARVTGAAGMTSLALAIERQTKEDLGRASHPYGTRTTARPGSAPALISGTLRRSIAHSAPDVTATGVSVRVGVASGFYPKYRSRTGRTPSSRYGFFLETGLRNGATYPFLGPAFHRVVDAAGAAQIGRWIASEWRAL